MTIANRYRGDQLVVQWINPAGTATMTGDYTKFDVDRSCDTIDASAGATADHEYLVGLLDGTAKLTFADTGASGSAIANQVKPGVAGTLLWGPLGTTSGKPKSGFAGLVKSHKFTEGIDAMTVIEVEFQKSGAMLFDYGSVWP